MTNKEFFMKCLEQEHPIFLRVFQALPEDKLDYRPHPRSMSAREIGGRILSDEFCNLGVIQKGEFNVDETEKNASLQEMITEFTQTHGELEKHLKEVDDQTWKEKKAKFSVQGQLVYEQPLGEFLWGVLFDQVHHRGQLSSYIRPMGGKVPSIYGPSGDDPGM
ncbi:DinB family protein [candidate division TA06 bacterium]|nr:DinB family protein [candidate division TA06 bacterium]